MPRLINTAAFIKLKVQRRYLRPNFTKRIEENKVETMFTTPTKAVPIVGLVPVEENIFEE
jgi:hypothetical protein